MDRTKSTVISGLRNNTILFRVCIVLCILDLGTNVVLSVKLRGAELPIGDMTLPAASLNGCIQVVLCLLGIIMVLIDHKKGLVCSYIFLGLSVAGAIRSAVVSHNLMTVPGLFNAVVFITAITLISRQIGRSRMMAVTDTVTGLRNRYGFDRDINRMIYRNEKGCVAFIHLDGFWPVNANLGRRYGDELLEITAGRITHALAKRGNAYKTEGAEFALILPEKSECTKIAEDVIKAVEETITLNKDGVPSNCYLSATAGLAEIAGSAEDADTVMKHADIAVNYALKSGSSKVCMFNDEMKAFMERQLYIERLVKESLQNGWFYLVYQPQYTIDDRRLRGFETLLRMNVPGGERIPPSEFISIAEMSDLVLDIDSFVIRRAMEEFREICYSSGNTITVAVNISAKDIARAGFADRLLYIINDVNFPPECLEIEITEYSFAEEGSHTIENIKLLRDNQIMIALDDFGTGYTSLGQVMKLPINLVKIDKSLIDNLVRNDMNIDFVKSVIYMGHLMDAEVIAEGVEQDSQVECLRELDCDFIQGFIWGKPMEYDEARELANEVYDRQQLS
ncbi:MAG: bifunctional diguanylate cyclase/phosphodiesterase [Lachnospiraceae bacterium]|nr:bifunctional diguanylate cyclase/phosphodiesterase [Lachnospiraceae bacterium]